MAITLNETIQSRCHYWRCTVVEQNVHAAFACNDFSNSTARRTALGVTSQSLAAFSSLPSAFAAALNAAVGTPLSSSMGCPNDRSGSITILLCFVLGHHLIGAIPSNSTSFKLASMIRLNAYCFLNKSRSWGSPVSEAISRKIERPSVLNFVVDSGRSSATYFRASKIAFLIAIALTPACMNACAVRISSRSRNPR